MDMQHERVTLNFRIDLLRVWCRGDRPGWSRFLSAAVKGYGV